ncbi:MAG: hypothetical protein KatS3mg061_3004 [Dehalococcoidia bacterium]|nr:MAG: hypothetical protein KatS3mg061_3004 [Dehalococcoidia bacterium]
MTALFQSGALCLLLGALVGALSLAAGAATAPLFDALQRGLLALGAFLVLGGMIALARRSPATLPAVGALVAVAGLAILLAGLTTEFWIIASEARERAALQQVGRLAALAGALTVASGCLALGLAAAPDWRRLALLLALPAVALLGVGGLSGWPVLPGLAIGGPLAVASLALGWPRRS